MDGKYFKYSEFKCKGTGLNITSPELIKLLDKVREEFGAAITVTSGYRDSSHNAAIGGHPNSTHTRGIAADICPSSGTREDLDRLYGLCCKYFKAVGDGRNRGFIHVDLRADKERRWNY